MRTQLLVACALASTMICGAAPNIERVVVIHLDTTRTDDFSCYGGVGKTPHIDAVADAGMRYTNSIVSYPKTSPSVASFLTGRLTRNTGVYAIGGKLPPTCTTLAEVLHERGFHTGAFVSNLVLARLKRANETPGFDQGFDVFEGIRAPRPSGTTPERLTIPVSDCEVVFSRALQYVEDHKKERFFLWVFNLDPHAPYSPPAPYDTMYLDHPELLAQSEPVPADRAHKLAYIPSRTMSHEYVARHLGEVTMIDDWIGKLLERLRPLPGRTLVVITADHGESMGDDDYWFAHGGNIRHPCVNVPLIIACEGVVPAGTCDALVANIDVAPTILDLLGLPYEELIPDGRSLVPTFEGVDPWPERMAPLRSMAQHWRGARSKHYSYQFQFRMQDGVLTEALFDLRDDPTETHDISGAAPDVTALHRSFTSAWFSPGAPRAAESSLADDPEMKERLRSLGYLE